MKTLFDTDRRYAAYGGTVLVFSDGKLYWGGTGRIANPRYDEKLFVDLIENWGAVEISEEVARERGLHENFV